MTTINIPSMGGAKIAPHLRAAAASVAPGHCAVEVGVWLGAGTVEIARGLHPDAELHCFDRFCATADEVRKAKRFGVRLRHGEDTSPRVVDLVSPVHPLTIHRGDIAQATWCGKPIDLYVDDAAKQPDTFRHVMRTLGPSWVVGETIVILMDLHFWRRTGREAHRCQQRFIDRHNGAFRRIRDLDQNGAMFRYVKPIRWSDV